MVVLEVILWILAAIILLLLLLLILPIAVKLEYKDEFKARVKYCFIPVFSTDKVKAEPNTTEQEKKTPKKKKPNIFKSIYKEKGLMGSVKYFAGLAEILINRLKYVLKHIIFRDIRFLLTVASADAAQTAINYGAVCSAVYPLFSSLFCVADCKAESIDVSADFNSEASKIEFSFEVRTLPIFLIIATITALFEYKKYKAENEAEN